MSLNGPEAPLSEGQFRRRLTVVTYSVLLVVLVVHLLQLFAAILKPLLIAGLIAYAILPPHRWLVRRGLRPALAYAVIVSLLLAAFLAVGQAVYDSVASLTPDKLNAYKTRLEALEGRGIRLLGGLGLETTQERLRRAVQESTLSRDDLVTGVRGAAGTFFGFMTLALVVFIYLVFLLAEKITFGRRVSLAFGDARAGEVLRLAQSVNEAIVNYIAVKTWISLITALMSLAVFLAFGVEFAFLWAILIFVLNFIPYLGGLVAMAPPVLLGFLGGETLWPGLLIILALTGIQLFTGQFVEPRLAGRRLNLSPLLILLALAFWGSLWGITGMLLAVPLTVVFKIVLDHVPETRPIATLMSNL